MNSPQSTDTLRTVIVLSHNGSEVLTVRDNRGDLILPRIEVDPNQRLAEQLNRKLQDSVGVRACYLFPVATDNGTDFDVLEHISNTGGRPLDTWLRVDSLREQPLTKEGDRLSIASAIREFQARVIAPPKEPFATPGWMPDLFNWIQAQLPGELELTGAFQQFNAEPSFALVRLETSGPAVWFKAVGEPNLREYAVTIELSRLFPCFVPELIGIRPEWHGWLSKEADGQQLAEVPQSLWSLGGLALAELQTRSTARIKSLLKAGCRDLRCESLLSLIAPFMSRMGELMAEQRKPSPAPLTEPELQKLADRLKIAIEEWDNLQIPDSIGHLDLNAENLLISEQRCTFLDWAEAYVGPPFLTFEYLRGCTSRLAHNAEGLDPKLANSYFGCWREYASARALLRAQELSPLLAVFAYAAGTDVWRERRQIDARGLAGYFRSLTRRMQRESQAITTTLTSSLSSTIG